MINNESYLYNADGQIIIKQYNSSNTTKYLYSGSEVLMTASQTGFKDTENILDPSGQIISSQRFDLNGQGTGWYSYNYDIRQSTTAILDEAGSLKTDYQYDSFGNVTNSPDSFLNETQFTGAIADSNTGLYYMNARYYNSNTGRFLSQDSYKGSAYAPWTQNLYSYVGNNPINMIDPTGHWGEKLGPFGLELYEYGIIHKAVQADIIMKQIAMGNLIYMECSIPHSSKTGGPGRCDLYGIGSGQIWEVKPVSHEGGTVGTEQLTRYIKNANIYGIKGSCAPSFKRGLDLPAGEFNIILPQCGEVTVVYHSGTGKEQGMVYYEIKEKVEQEQEVYTQSSVQAYAREHKYKSPTARKWEDAGKSALGVGVVAAGFAFGALLVLDGIPGDEYMAQNVIDYGRRMILTAQ